MILPGFPSFVPMHRMNGPEFIGSEEGFRSSGTSVNVAVPADTFEGDLMIAFVFTAASGRTPVAPSGWTTITSDGDGQPGAGIFIKIFESGDPLNYSFPITGSSSNLRGAILTFRGATGVSSGGSVTRYSSSITASADSISLFGGGAIISAFYSNQAVANAAISIPPVGMDQATDASSSASNPTSYIFYRVPTTAGPSGAKSLTFSNAANLAAVSVEVVP